MGSNNSKGSPKGPNKKQTSKKSGYEKFIAIGIIVIAITLIGKFVLGSNNNGSNNVSSSGSNSQAVKVDPASIVAGIEIKKGEITEKAKFYPYEADGIKMEVLALKAPDGSIRTAFNTCQVCYSSGKGYYVQQGNELVCQNCGNRFKADKVGIVKGGCNPVPIENGGKVDDGSTIKIDKAYLNKNKAYFSNWKV
jgi:serine/threonine protein kinase HipA of HipAB toxin-antitoxin module